MLEIKFCFLKSLPKKNKEADKMFKKFYIILVIKKNLTIKK